VIAAGAAPIAAPKRMPWGLEVAYARAPDETILGLSEPQPSYSTYTVIFERSANEEGREITLLGTKAAGRPRC
jgi:hypothetical protein